MTAAMWALPPRTRARPYRAMSRSAASTPFWSDMIAVSGPMSGAADSIASCVDQSFTAMTTRSAEFTEAGLSVALTGRMCRLPSGLSMLSPDSRIAARCFPRAMNVTSLPDAARRPPK